MGAIIIGKKQEIYKCKVTNKLQKNKKIWFFVENVLQFFLFCCTIIIVKWVLSKFSKFSKEIKEKINYEKK